MGWVGGDNNSGDFPEKTVSSLATPTMDPVHKSDNSFCYFAFFLKASICGNYVEYTLKPKQIYTSRVFFVSLLNHIIANLLSILCHKAIAWA